MNIIVTNVSLTNLGVNNGAAAAASDGKYTYDEMTALFMKKFSGEVYNAMRRKCLFKDLQRTRTIKNGKSASFNYTGRMSARYHERGTPILGSNNPPISEQIINVDDLLIADVAIDAIDELMLHFDVRTEYSFQMGEALALAYDDRVARIATLAARHAAMNKDQQGGSVISHTKAETDGQTLADMIFLAAQTLDEKDVDESDRHIIVKPAQYYMLTKVKDLIDRDYGGSGSIKDSKLESISGMKLHRSMRLPNGKNITTKEEGENNSYLGNFTKSVALVMNRQAVGTVKMWDLAVEMSGHDYHVMYQADLIVAKYAMGHGILRPDCAVEIAIA